MFARIKNNQITEYPLTEWNIRERIRFFGSAPNFDVLLPADYVRVQEGSRPSPNIDENLVEAQPVMLEGKWTRNWVIVPKSPEEIEPVVLSPMEQECSLHLNQMFRQCTRLCGMKKLKNGIRSSIKVQYENDYRQLRRSRLHLRSVEAFVQYG